MVLQRDMPVAIWGWASPGEKVTVRFVGQTVQATADPAGRWKAALAALTPGEPADMVIEGNQSEPVTLKNILVGEVWLCSGQSNMELPMTQTKNAKAEIAAAKYPTIRLFQVKNTVADAPKDDCTGQWKVCDPASVADFSAVGYFFGRELHKDLDVPIGLIDSSWGGTPAEAWTSRPALDAKPSLAPLLKQWDKRKGAVTRPGGRYPLRPACLYNGMIAPLTPLAIRGAIWYQGEGNVVRAHQYRTIFPTMIADWRKAWAQPEMPFGFVQIAPYRYNKKGPTPEATCCAELWEAQLLTLKSVPAVGMAVTTDLGNPKNIHPTNKQDVGRRLALWARAKVYGRKDLVYSGPIYRSMKIEGRAIRLSFDHVGGGLIASDGKPLTHFTIAGPDEKFHPATAKLDGQTIVVSSERVAAPVAVRFAWHETAQPNLKNQEGLPASPFRTDSFRGVTEGRN